MLKYHESYKLSALFNGCHRFAISGRDNMKNLLWLFA